MTNKLVALAASIALITVACSSGSSTTTTEAEEPASTAPSTTAAPGGSQTVTVTLADVDANTMVLTPSPDSVAPGEVTFEVTNSGDKEHEFVVFKTDLAIENLPFDESADEVIEDGEGVTHIDEIESIQPGETKTLTVNLDAGNYALICNLKGHYRMGMRSAFTVG